MENLRISVCGGGGLKASALAKFFKELMGTSDSSGDLKISTKFSEEHVGSQDASGGSQGFSQVLRRKFGVTGFQWQGGRAQGFSFNLVLGNMGHWCGHKVSAEFLEEHLGSQDASGGSQDVSGRGAQGFSFNQVLGRIYENNYN